MTTIRTNSLMKGSSASMASFDQPEDPWKNVSDTEASTSSDDEAGSARLRVMVDFAGTSRGTGNPGTSGQGTCTFRDDEFEEVLPALPLRSPTADHAHFHPRNNRALSSSHAAPLHPGATAAATANVSHSPAVFQYPLPQAVSRESRHVSNMIRIFGSVDSIQHNIAAGKNSGYVDSSQVNCDPKASAGGTGPSVKHTFLPHLPLSILLNDQQSSSPRTRRPDTMESSFRGTPRSGRGPSTTPRGFTCDSAASTFFRINTPRVPYKPPGTSASGKTFSACATPREGLASRGSMLGGSPRHSVRHPPPHISGDDVLASDRAFVIAETHEFEKSALPQAKEHRAYIRQMTSDNLLLFRSEQMTSALLRKMFHTKVALECDVAKKLSVRGKEDMGKLAVDVKVAMNRLGLRQLDPLDFHTFLITLLDDPSVPFSDSRYLFTLIDTNASKMIDVNELAEGLELLSMDEDQITLSFCQKLFAEPNKYRDVRLSYHEVVSIFRCVLAFYGANDNVVDFVRKAEEAEQQQQHQASIMKQREIEIDPPVPEQSPSLQLQQQLSFVVPPVTVAAGPASPQTLSPVQSGLVPPKQLKKAGLLSSRLVRPTLDTIKRRLEAEVTAVVRQVWRFSASKGGQIHIPLLRTLMAADGPLVVTACQAIPQSLKPAQSRLLKDLLAKEVAAYDERLAAMTGEADAMLSVKEVKPPGSFKKANSSMSGMSDGSRKAAAAAAASLHRLNEDFDSTLLKGRPLPYDEVAAIYERYEGGQFIESPKVPQPPTTGAPAATAGGKQQQHPSSRRQSQSLQRGQSTVSNKPLSSSQNQSPADAPAAEVPALIRRPTAILTSTGEVAADPWHPRFTADVNKVNDMERQRSAREHTSEVFVSEGKIVLRIDENGVKIPWVS